MRLTLRTMLCYLDDILEPEDKTDLGKKIEDSEYATNLVHRIRDVTQRMRLGSPKLHGKGMGLDPNTVAEYLDNVLPAERVPDFEKVCLESDVQLAEAASCHQVLTLVLGEAAQVEPSIRRRVYELAGGATAGVDGPHGAPHAGPPPRTVEPAVKEKPEIPDYLREPKGIRWWTIAATLLVAAGIGAIAVLAIGPEKVAKMVGLKKDDQQIVQNTDNKSGTPADPNAGKETPADNTTENKGPTEPGPKPESGDVTPAVPVEPKPEPKPVEPGPTDPAKGTNDGASTKPEMPVEPGPAVPRDPLKETPGPTEPPKPSPTDVAGTTPKPPVDPTAPLPIDLKNAPPLVEPKPAEPVPASVAGICLTEDELLLKWNPAGRWERVGARETVRTGESLLVCPTYRPMLALNAEKAGMTLQIAGDTFVRMLPPDENNVPGIEVYYGRIVLTPSGNTGSRLRIQVGDRSGTIVFAEGAAEVACEVRLFRAPGTDPESVGSQAAAEIYATSGLFRWLEKAGAEPQVVNTPNRVVIAPYPGEAPETMKELPKWVKAEQISDLDRRASKKLFKSLAESSDVAVRLRELATDRAIEIRALAIRCLAEFGEFDDLIASLRDEEQKLMWQPYFETVQASVARDPKRAAAVRVALEKQRGDKALELYRMFWGYSKADLDGGQAAKLVDYLDHENLDIRVLSFFNLKAITGMSLLYRPDTTPAQRKQAVATWKQRLKEGQVTVKQKGP